MVLSNTSAALARGKALFGGNLKFRKKFLRWFFELERSFFVIFSAFPISRFTELRVFLMELSSTSKN